MTTGDYAAIEAARATTLAGPDERLRRAWRRVAVLLVAGFFGEAALAGAMLSGFGWARAAHAVTAGLLVAGSLIAGLVAALALRRVRRGARLVVALLGLAVAGLLQAAVGVLAAK